VCPGLLDPQVSLARSEKAPIPKVHAVVSHATSPAMVARPEVPADQRADDRCSYSLGNEGEPSKI
jgi:hypothetical protein